MTSVKLTNTTNSPFAVVDINGRSVVFHVNKPVEGDFSGDSLNELFALKSSFGYESAIQSASFKKYNSISFFGDSITNGANASDDAHKWVGLIAGLHGAATVRNKGNSGTVLQNSADSAFTPKTGNGRDSFGAALLGSNKSDAVYIAYGFNDMRYVGYPVNFNKDNYTKDYRELLTGLIVGGYNPEDIYIFSPYYITDAGITTGSTGWAGQTRLKIKEYVDATRSVAIEFGCNYFEMYDSLNSLTWINDVNSNDKIHPSNIGHAMIRDVVKKGGGGSRWNKGLPKNVSVTVKSDGSGDATVNYTPVYGVSGYEFSAIGLENSVLLKYAQSSPNLQAMPSGLKVVPLVRAVDTDGNKSPWVVGGASTSQVSRSGVFSDDFANTVFSSNPSDGHFSESGHWYTMHPQYSGNYWPLISSESRLYLPGSTSNVGVAIANYTHSSANYSVVSDVTPLSEESARSVFILGRFDPTANTGYFFGYTAGTGFRLFKVVEGTQTQLGSTTSGNLGGHKHTLTLTMNGTTITGTAKDTVSGATVATISVTDSGISSVGRVGYRLSQGVTETTGVHMDNLFVLAVS